MRAWVLDEGFALISQLCRASGSGPGLVVPSADVTSLRPFSSVTNASMAFVRFLGQNHSGAG